MSGQILNSLYMRTTANAFVHVIWPINFDIRMQIHTFKSRCRLNDYTYTFLINNLSGNLLYIQWADTWNYNSRLFKFNHLYFWSRRHLKYHFYFSLFNLKWRNQKHYKKIIQISPTMDNVQIIRECTVKATHDPRYIDVSTRTISD